MAAVAAATPLALRSLACAGARPRDRRPRAGRARESFIAINADHLPVRQRFTLAHEWAHIEAGHTPRVELTADLLGRSKDPQEVEANYFAAELLAPQEGLVRWLAEHDATPNVDAASVAQMAMQFGVGLRTACYRLKRAGVISKARTEELVSTFKAEGRSYAQRFEEDRYQDALEEISSKSAYPRIPKITHEYASEALKVNLIDQREYEEIMDARDRLDAWLA